MCVVWCHCLDDVAYGCNVWHRISGSLEPSQCWRVGGSSEGDCRECLCVCVCVSSSFLVFLCYTLPWVSKPCLTHSKERKKGTLILNFQLASSFSFPTFPPLQQNNTLLPSSLILQFLSRPLSYPLSHSCSFPLFFSHSTPFHLFLFLFSSITTLPLFFVYFCSSLPPLSCPL